MVSIVTNIDRDHMETYGGDWNRLKETFIEFLHHLPFYGLAVVCLDDSGVQEVLADIHKPVRTYGLNPQAEVHAFNIRREGLISRFTVGFRGREETLEISLKLPGTHNILNALAVIAVALELGVDDAVIQNALENFHGIGRRFQINAEIPLDSGSITLVDDYGHHPREVAATLDSVRQVWPMRRKVLIFQPHRFTRTRDLFEDFVEILGKFDVLILLEVYSAGETPVVGADSRSLSRAIRLRGRVDPIFMERPGELPEILARLLQPGDVVLTQGAGNIGALAADLPQRLKALLAQTVEARHGS
jgi:UDP-N-acetylmuramate--alanine ligase